MKKQFNGEKHWILRTFNGKLASVYYVKLCQISVFTDQVATPNQVLLKKLCVCVCVCVCVF